MKNNIAYLVGYERDNDFWCVFETPSLENARTYLNSNKNSSDYDVWSIYEKTTSYKIIESAMSLESKEERLVKSMVEAI